MAPCAKTVSASPTLVPALDTIADDPTKAASLPLQVATALLARCTVVQSALIGRLLVDIGAGSREAEAQGHAQDRLLTAEKAAPILNTTPRWLYRHHKNLPFTRRLSRKCLRFSEAGLMKWLAVKKS